MRVLLITITIILVSAFLFTSCSQDELEGSWVGYAIVQQDSIFDQAKADRCSLFLKEDYYFFRGNTGVIEKGIYDQHGEYLTLEDTLRSANAKKIAYELKNDTLVLTMNKNGESLQLNMRRTQAEVPTSSDKK